MILRLINTITKTDYNFNVEDRKNSLSFFSFIIDLPENMQEGEYSYYVIDADGSILSQGLLRYGDYKTENKAYFNQNKTIKQYMG